MLVRLLLGLLALGGCSLPQQQAGAPTEQRLGTQWGDEGKGKIVDLLTEKQIVYHHFVCAYTDRVNFNVFANR